MLNGVDPRTLPANIRVDYLIKDLTLLMSSQMCIKYANDLVENGQDHFIENINEDLYTWNYYKLLNNDAEYKIFLRDKDLILSYAYLTELLKYDPYILDGLSGSDFDNIRTICFKLSNFNVYCFDVFYDLVKDYKTQYGN